MVLSSNAPQNGTNVMDKDQWLIISGLQIRRDEAQRIPTLFRLFRLQYGRNSVGTNLLYHLTSLISPFVYYPVAN